MLIKPRWTVSLALLGMLFVAGCGNATKSEVAESKSTAKTETADSEEAGKHDGWWCAEHGVPEGECSRCDASLIAGFKEKGGWCKEHGLPESQCFKCDPKRAEKFIARYEAKFGKKPPEQPVPRHSDTAVFGTGENGVNRERELRSLCLLLFKTSSILPGGAFDFDRQSSCTMTDVPVNRVEPLCSRGSSGR